MITSIQENASLLRNDPENSVLIKDAFGELFQICIGHEGLLFGSRINSMGEEEVFHRIHGLPRQVQRPLSVHFKLELSQNGIPRVRFGELHVDFRLRGGFGPLAVGLGAISGISSVLSSRNYVDLAREGHAMIRTAGNESRATIRTAESAVTSTISNTRNSVNDCVRRSSRESQAILDRAKGNLNDVINNVGIEGRSTARVVAIQAESVLKRAALEADRTIKRSALEVQKTLRVSRQEAQTLTYYVSEESKGLLTHMSIEANTVIDNSSSHIVKIMNEAAKETKGVIESGGEEVSKRVQEILTKASESIESTSKIFLTNFEESMGRLIPQISGSVSGLIIEAGSQGRMLIKDTGGEIRATADHVMGSALLGSQLLVTYAGEQASLTIHEANKELRTTLYEIPYIAGKSGEALGKGIVEGAIEGLFRPALVTALIRKLENAIRFRDNVRVTDVLDFIGDQDQDSVTPEGKAQLYRAVIREFNGISTMGVEAKRAAFIMIGVQVWKDLKLIYDAPSWLPCFSAPREVDLRAAIISDIPNRDTRALLMDKKERALEELEPRIEEIETIRWDEVQREMSERIVLLEEELLSIEDEASVHSVNFEELQALREVDMETHSRLEEELQQKGEECHSLQKELEREKGVIAALRDEIAYIQSQ